MTKRPLPSSVLAERMLELRSRKGWTQDELAARMNEQGWSWVRSTVAKIESGTRQVVIDELVSLAYVFDVPLPSLLVPTRFAATVALTPVTIVQAHHAWTWMSGLGSMADTPDERRFYEEAHTEAAVAAERALPGLRSLGHIVGLIERDAGALEHVNARQRQALVENLAARAEHLAEDVAHLRRRIGRLGKGTDK